jgi:ribosomal protein L16 Arg81 hydroxylase
MKRYLLIVTLFLLTGFAAISQDDDNPERGGGKLQQRMQDYIQQKLNLTRNEAEKFSPIFLRYISELRRTHRENVNDLPTRQLKIAELRVRFRNEFKQVFDEQRANKVYEYQREFLEKVKIELQNRGENHPIRNPRRFR